MGRGSIVCGDGKGDGDAVCACKAKSGNSKTIFADLQRSRAVALGPWLGAETLQACSRIGASGRKMRVLGVRSHDDEYFSRYTRWM